MNPNIKNLPATNLVGLRASVSFVNDRTAELWENFMPRRKEITDPVSDDLYSVEVYPDLDFFKAFDPSKSFDKWAAMAVDELANIPDGMESLKLPSGEYAVFHYKGRASEAKDLYHYIFTDWLPNSGKSLDHRPHFALMGKKYRGESDDSEEEIWIPIRA